jgi:hypothetical protein
MNPKPLEVLKNFTVPMVIAFFLVVIHPGDMPEWCGGERSSEV